MNENVIKKEKVSVKFQTLATLFAIVSAVAFPQICHTAGAAMGVHNALGEILLPMHLPIIFTGLLAGPYAAAIAGFLSPLVSFYLTDMPSFVMLPFMMIELFGYGLSAGLLKNVKMPSILKVLTSQIAGRLIRAAAICIAVYAFGSQVAISTIWMSIPKGIIGLSLQWLLIPIVLKFIEKLKKYD